MKNLRLIRKHSCKKVATGWIGNREISLFFLLALEIWERDLPTKPSKIDHYALIVSDWDKNLSRYFFPFRLAPRESAQDYENEIRRYEQDSFLYKALRMANKRIRYIIIYKCPCSLRSSFCSISSHNNLFHSQVNHKKPCSPFLNL